MGAKQETRNKVVKSIEYLAVNGYSGILYRLIIKSFLDLYNKKILCQ